MSRLRGCKARAKLDRRLRDYAELGRTLDAKQYAGYRKPGSGKRG